MRVLGFLLENFMRVRVVEIKPTRRVTIVSGKNGQGKTSLMHGLMATLLGKRATTEKPVRNGAKNASGTLWVGDGEHELVITRTINKDRSQSLRVEPAKNGRITGDPFKSPQEVLNALVGEMAEDPLAFIGMAPKEQIEVLRRVSKVDCDFEALNTENKRDFDERTAVGREVRRIEGELRGMTVQAGLPAEKMDEEAVRLKLHQASDANAQAQALDRAKSEIGRKVDAAARNVVVARGDLGECRRQIARLREQMIEAEEREQRQAKDLAKATEDLNIIQGVWEVAPAGHIVDVSVIAAELENVQLVNREIDKRVRREAVEDLLRTEQRKSMDLTRAIEARDEQKAQALRDAKMPLDGLTFDEESVLFKGIPLTQLGEAEQLRVSAEIMMAGEPKLRILPIWRGEALDDDNVAMLDQLAEAHDFHVLMLKVDSTGSVGIVLEDGEVKAVNV
jgi:DNA repair exonuclease SbcCD ATPase subunit